MSPFSRINEINLSKTVVSRRGPEEAGPGPVALGRRCVPNVRLGVRRAKAQLSAGAEAERRGGRGAAQDRGAARPEELRGSDTGVQERRAEAVGTQVPLLCN